MPTEILESRIAPAAFVVTNFVVTNLHDSGTGSLRDTITTADADHGTDTITFAAGLHGKIALKSQLPAITENLTITGPGPSKLTIDGGKKHAIFYLGDNTNAYTISISGVTISHGNAPTGGAVTIQDPGGYVTLSNCTISGNTAIGVAGNAITAATYAKGGAIDLENGTLTLSQAKITGNSAKGAPGFSGYTGANGLGGALYIGQSGTATLQNCVVSGNTATGGIGLTGAKGAKTTAGQPGYYGGNGGYGGKGAGGGIFNDGILTIQGSTISGNLAAGGNGGKGGVGGKGGAKTPSYAPGNGGNGGTGGNAGNGVGGGIESYNSTMNISSSTISGNTALAGKAGKGGAAGKGGGPVQVVNGQSYGTPGLVGTAGTAGASSGGGIDTYNGYLGMIQVTVAGNTAGTGGGLNINQDSTTEIDNSTIGLNHALVDGGGLFVTPDSNSDAVNLVSTIVGQNVAPAGLGFDISGPVSADHSLIQIVANATITNVTSTNITGQSALLGTLANHGGPTETLLPSATGPVLNAGSNPDNLLYDQRGEPFPRVFGTAIDIGAVEVG